MDKIIKILQFSELKFQKLQKQFQYLFASIMFVLVSAAITFGFRKFYYFIFPWVLSKNIIFPKGTLTPWIEAWSASRDGIEIYVLYVMMFLLIATMIAWINISKILVKKWLIIGIASIAFWFSRKLWLGIEFTPPSEAIVSIHHGIKLCVIFIFAILSSLYCRSKLSGKLEILFISIFLIPLCFIATGPIDINNYAYVFSPAQKILEGVNVSQIYFQYDIFLSLLAAAWMYVGISLTKFQFLGQLSNYVAIFGIYLMARNLFQKKALSFLLLISLVLVRIASAPWDPVYVFQITPLRLDLWLIPFSIIFFQGPKHWLISFICGILILIHGPFGIIYTLSYIQLSLTLFTLLIIDKGFKASLIELKNAKIQFKIMYTALFLAACLTISHFVFGLSHEATSWYQKIGIGFIPLAKTSFFWIYPVILTSAFALLYFLRKKVSIKYLSLGFILIYFTLGNCIYFFGRSHEMNLFSISIPLVFLLFFTLDLFDRLMEQSPFVLSKYLSILLGVIFLGVVEYKCSDRIQSNLILKYKNAKSFNLPPGDPFKQAQVETNSILNEIRQITGVKSNIQFFIADEGKEFLFYQEAHGNSSFFYPFSSWIFLDQLLVHAQNLINDGSYILIDQKIFNNLLKSKINGIGYRYETKNGGYVLISLHPPGNLN